MIYFLFLFPNFVLIYDLFPFPSFDINLIILLFISVIIQMKSLEE